VYHLFFIFLHYNFEISNCLAGVSVVLYWVIEEYLNETILFSRYLNCVAVYVWMVYNLPLSNV